MAVLAVRTMDQEVPLVGRCLPAQQPVEAVLEPAAMLGRHPLEPGLPGKFGRGVRDPVQGAQGGVPEDPAGGQVHVEDADAAGVGGQLQALCENLPLGGTRGDPCLQMPPFRLQGRLHRPHLGQVVETHHEALDQAVLPKRPRLDLDIPKVAVGVGRLHLEALRLTGQGRLQVRMDLRPDGRGHDLRHRASLQRARGALVHRSIGGIGDLVVQVAVEKDELLAGALDDLPVPAQLQFGLFAFVDVDMGAHHPQWGAVGRTLDHLAAAQDPAVAAGLGAHPELQLAIARVLQRVLSTDENIRALLGVEQIEPGVHLRRQLVRLIAQHPGISGTVIGHPGGAVPVPEPVAGRLHRVAEALLALVQPDGGRFEFRRAGGHARFQLGVQRPD